MLGGDEWMKNNMTNDMTKGNPTKLILLFSIPLLIGNIFQQFYTMADTMMVGKILGVQALAAMGATSALSNLMIGLISGIAMGVTILIAAILWSQR